MKDEEIEFSERSDRQHCDIVVRDIALPPEFTFHGLWPDDSLRENMVRALNKILSFAPYKANLRFRFEKHPGGFRFLVRLQSPGGVLTAAASAPQAHEGLRLVLDKIYLEIRNWRKETFMEQNGSNYLSEMTRRVSLAEPLENETFAFRPKVLIVDDNPFSTKLMESCLKQQGCETFLARNGLNAVREITTRDLDLVILDWQMPEMNGAETLLSAQDKIAYDSTFRIPWVTNSLPIVVYSGLDVSKLHVPECDNFQVIGQLSKMAPYLDLKRSMVAILHDLRPV